jgi:hypothetical protein
MCSTLSHLAEPNPKATFVMKAWAKGWDNYRVGRAWEWLQRRQEKAIRRLAMQNKKPFTTKVNELQAEWVRSNPVEH